MPFTNLQAINAMLTSVGETAVLTLVSGASDVTNAQTILDAETLKVLSKGWHCNSDSKFPLSPDADGKIAVPADALQIDATDTRVDITQRGGFLYDLAGHTFVFTKPVECDIVRALPFESLPFPLQQRIVAQAVLRYQRSYVGSKQLDDFHREELAVAQADAEDGEAGEDDLNILDNPDIAYQVYRTSGRRVL